MIRAELIEITAYISNTSIFIYIDDRALPHTCKSLVSSTKEVTEVIICEGIWILPSKVIAEYDLDLWIYLKTSLDEIGHRIEIMILSGYCPGDFILNVVIIPPKTLEI